jgi:DNA-binding transcriptional LysR family regulator
MTLIQLKYLCTIAEEGSFSRAAEKLFVSQPALSMQIKALEEEVGQPLLDRSGSHVTLTEPGGLLAERAKEAATALDDAKEEIRRAGAGNALHCIRRHNG